MHVSMYKIDYIPRAIMYTLMKTCGVGYSVVQNAESLLADHEQCNTRLATVQLEWFEAFPNNVYIHRMCIVHIMTYLQSTLV